MVDLPQVIILSTQRSGTHLLLSFLNKHSRIKGRGEIFHKYKKEGIIDPNTPGMINVGILMYNQTDIFRKLGGDFRNHKLIHLLRTPREVALSVLQMEADKVSLGSHYKAHYHQTDLGNYNRYVLPNRGIPNIKNIDKHAERILDSQSFYRRSLEDIHHLELNYADFVKDGQTVERLDPNVQLLIYEFLELKHDQQELYTTYIKTGLF